MGCSSRNRKGVDFEAEVGHGHAILNMAYRTTVDCPEGESRSDQTQYALVVLGEDILGSYSEPPIQSISNWSFFLRSNFS